MATHQVFSVPQQAIGRVDLLAPVPKVALFFLSAASISNVMCDIKEDNSIHVTDVASHRVFRLREVPKPGVPAAAATPLILRRPAQTPA